MEQFNDIEDTDSPLVKEIAEVFKKHGFVAFVYSAAKENPDNDDLWFIDTTICIDDDHVPLTIQADCLDTMMTDLVDVANGAIHDIQDSTPKSAELKH